MLKNALVRRGIVSAAIGVLLAGVVAFGAATPAMAAETSDLTGQTTAASPQTTESWAAADGGTVIVIPPSDTSIAPLAKSDCPSNNFCMWSDSNYSGRRWQSGGLSGDANLHNDVCSGCISSKHPGSNGTWGDQMTSYWNNTSTSWCVFVDANYRGPLAATVGASSPGISGRFNDEVSSLRPAGSGCL